MAYQSGVAVIIDEIALRLTSDWSLDSSVSTTRAVGLMTVLMSSLQLARAVADEKVVQQVLTAGIENARVLMTNVGHRDVVRGGLRPVPKPTT